MTDAPYKPTVSQRFTSNLRSMPGWQKLTLMLSLIIGVAGGVGSIASYFTAGAESPSAPSSTDTPANARGVVDSSSQRDGGSTSVTDESPTFWQRMAPHARNFGFSVVIGFLAGWFFRTFLKTMAFVTAIVLTGFFLLSYFNVLSIDLAGMKTQYDSITHWLAEQGSRLKDLVFSYLPSTTGAFVGAFLGFLRR